MTSFLTTVFTVFTVLIYLHTMNINHIKWEEYLQIEKRDQYLRDSCQGHPLQYWSSWHRVELLGRCRLHEHCPGVCQLVFLGISCPVQRHLLHCRIFR